MSWSEDLVAVRGSVVEAIQLVWPGITVAVDAPDKDFGIPFARVVTQELEFHSDSVSIDRLEVLFEIRIRRAVASGIVSEALLENAADLRVALLADLNPAGVAELPMVKKVWIEKGSQGDEEFELRMEFSCDICAERGG
ncbi:MAG: hypothetical protein ACKVQS_04560 [Fimbriimonadaceae bacterium]